MDSFIKIQLSYNYLLTIYPEQCDGENGVSIKITDYNERIKKADIFLNDEDINAVVSALKTLALISKKRNHE